MLLENLLIQPASILAPALTLKARPSHLANLMSVIGTDQTTVVQSLSPLGVLTLGSGLTAAAQLDVTPASTVTTAVRIQQRASQLADALDVTTSANVVTMSVAANGAVIASQNTAQQALIGNLAGSGGIWSGSSLDTALTRAAAAEWTTNKITHVASAVGQVPVLTKGIASQTANLLEVQSSAAAVLCQISAAGNVAAGGIGTSTQVFIGNGSVAWGASLDALITRTAAADLATNRMTHTSTAVGQVPLVTKGFASQTGNLLEAQDSTAAVLAKIAASGAMTALSFTANGTTTTGQMLANGNVGAQVGTANQVVIGNTFGLPVLAFGATGAAVIYAPSSTALTALGQFTHTPSTAAQVVEIILGAASQTGDLFRAENSAAATLWYIDPAGIPGWGAAANIQTTVGAAGAASALPALPSKYLKVKDSAGSTFVVPCYAP